MFFFHLIKAVRIIKDWPEMLLAYQWSLIFNWVKETLAKTSVKTKYVKRLFRYPHFTEDILTQ